ncbi:MAG: 6-oxopurine nucleoside phosphorylase, partial [Archaeoglobus sp.]
MTAGSEATVAKELGIAYAAICTVDNYAHGIRGETVDYREIVKKAGESARVCLEIVFNSVRRLLERG